MKRYQDYKESQIVRETEEFGESIEEMVRRCVASNEPIENSAPMVYTEKAKGVLPEFDIRTDRQELALDATDKFQASEIARQKAAEETPKTDGGEASEPTVILE